MQGAKYLFIMKAVQSSSFFYGLQKQKSVGRKDLCDAARMVNPHYDALDVAFFFVHFRDHLSADRVFLFLFRNIWKKSYKM